MMKKIILLLLLLSTNYLIKAQSNEFLFLAGKGIGSKEHNSNVFQFQYNNQFSKLFSFQCGIRQYSRIDPIIDDYNIFIDNACFSRKLDLSMLLVPLNYNKLKVEIGGGFNFGYLRYYTTAETISVLEEEREEKITRLYGRHYYKRDLEPHIHAMVQCSYYFADKLFLLGQFLYDTNISSPSQNDIVLPKNMLSINIGLGCRF